MTTTTIENTVVQLEGVVNGYQTLLREAKAQLETLDIDNAKLDHIASKLAQDPSFRSYMASGVASFLVRSNLSEEDGEFVSAISTRIYNRVLARIQEDIKQPLEQTIAAMANSEVIEQKVLEMLTTNKSIKDLVDLAGHLRAISEITKSFESDG